MVEDNTNHTSDEQDPAERVHAVDREDLPPAETAPRPVNPVGYKFVENVTLRITVDLGKAEMRVRDVLALNEGSVIELDKLAGEMIEVSVQGIPLGRGEVMVISDSLGVRLTEVGLDHKSRELGEGDHECAKIS